MLFKDFVGFLNKLEVTSSRLEITDILVDLIKSMGVADVAKGVYLVLGMLGPDFDNAQFGMAAKMVIRSVAEGNKADVKEVERKYKQIGDIGELAKEYEFSGKKKEYTVEEVFGLLEAIALDSGAGSQERKVLSLERLFLETTVEERKYIARMVLGKLRLGFSSKTIFDALSQMESGNKQLRKELDSVFQIFPDTGYITQVVKEKGMLGLKNIKIKTGVPVVPALCQRLNEYGEIVEKMRDVAVERKYDGTRVQIHFKKGINGEDDLIRTYTRNLEETSKMFPELKNLHKWVKADEIVLDCEAVGWDKKRDKVLPFQVTITRKRKHGIDEMAESVPLKFFLFDVLSKNGESLIEKPYFERRKILAESIRENEVVVVDEFVRADESGEVEKLHENYLKEGYEGAVIKKWDGGYLPGRQGWNWVKIKEAEGSSGKLSDTLDLVILGYYLGRGKRADFGIGAFLVGLKKSDSWVSLAKIGTGLTDDEFKDLKKKLDDIKIKEKPENYFVEGALKADVWVEPKLVCEVAADEITISSVHAGGIALRFPRLVRFRNDKGAKESTTWEEVEQIAKISKV